jgi:hypothetical protein
MLNGRLGTVHPTPDDHLGWSSGVEMISTVGSSTFAELTARRITGARGRDMSEALHARPAPPRLTVRSPIGGAGAFRCVALCVRQVGPLVWAPCLAAVGGQHLRGVRLQYARWSIYRRRVAPERCAPGGPARGCCLLRGSRFPPLQRGVHHPKAIFGGSKRQGVSGTLTPEVLWQRHRERLPGGLQPPGAGRFSFFAVSEQPAHARSLPVRTLSSHGRATPHTVRYATGTGATTPGT